MILILNKSTIRTHKKNFSDDVDFYDKLIKSQIESINKYNQFKHDLKERIKNREMLFNEDQLEFTDPYAEQIYMSENLSDLAADKYNLSQYFSSNTEYDQIKKRHFKKNVSCISSEEVKNQLQTKK